MPDIRFVLIGGMKCGSSSLYDEITAHPLIYSAPVKEPRLLALDGFLKSSQVQARYNYFFRQCPDGVICGDGSTHFSKYPEYPMSVNNVYEYLGRIPVVYIVRNIFERIESHYSHDKSAGLINKNINISEAVRSYPPLINCSLYGQQIHRWEERFGKEFIYVCTLLDMQRDKERVLTDIWTLIGVPPIAVQPELNRLNMSEGRYAPAGLIRHLVNSSFYLGVRHFIPKYVRDKVKVTVGRDVSRYREKLNELDRKYILEIVYDDLNNFCRRYDLNIEELISE